MNKLDEPKTVLKSFYKHQEEITRQTESQARHVGRAVDSVVFLVKSCRDPALQKAVIEAAAYVIQGVWHNRVVCGLADGENFDQFWQLVLCKFDDGAAFMRVCRSETRVRSFTLEIKPTNSVEAFCIYIEP